MPGLNFSLKVTTASRLIWYSVRHTDWGGISSCKYGGMHAYHRLVETIGLGGSLVEFASLGAVIA